MKITRSVTFSLLVLWPALLSASPGGPIISALAGPAYTLHEWGTFTTVSGSDGLLLPGLEREEEALPDFVYSHEGMVNELSMRAIKGWRRPLANVTVKMETPVIYFYTHEPFHARVQVGFRGGSISQWFPDRSGGETPPPVKRNAQGARLSAENTLDFGHGYNGRIQWDVDIAPAGDDAFGRIFKREETLNWLFPRQTDSALVTNAKGESEKYLFYRGVGNFEPPVVFSSSSDGTLTIKNRAGSAVPALFIFRYADDGQVSTQRLGPLAAGAEIATSLPAMHACENWQKSVYDDGVEMLTAAGLYRKEADAMMQTWWRSYFQREGLRVFWIVPEETVARVLPLDVTPAPAKTVRVLVGRSEILTPIFEQRLAADIAAKPDDNGWVNDRYYGAYRTRVEQLNRAASAPQRRPDKQAATSSRTGNHGSHSRTTGDVTLMKWANSIFGGLAGLFADDDC